MCVFFGLLHYSILVLFYQETIDYKHLLPFRLRCFDGVTVLVPTPNCVVMASATLLTGGLNVISLSVSMLYREKRPSRVHDLRKRLSNNLRKYRLRVRRSVTSRFDARRRVAVGHSAVLPISRPRASLNANAASLELCVVLMHCQSLPEERKPITHGSDSAHVHRENCSQRDS